MSTQQKCNNVISIIFLIVFIISQNGYVKAQLSEDQIEAFRSAKTVRIVINQSYLGSTGLNLPFKSTTKRLLNYAGKDTVSSDSEGYELKLIIDIKGKAWGHKYYDYSYYGDLGVLYTGAEVSGSINLECPGFSALKKDFSGIIRPPELFDGSPEKYKFPIGAPYWKASIMRGSFLSQFIEMMGEIYGLDYLLMALEDPDENVKRNVIDALGNTGDPRAIEPLTSALKDTSLPIRKSAVTALENINLPDAIDPLLSVMGDKDIGTLATNSLGKIKDPRAIEILMAALKHENSQTRINAAVALRYSKDPRVIEALISALNDDVWGVSANAANSLNKITGKKIGRSYKKWKKWWEKNKRKFIKNN